MAEQAEAIFEGKVADKFLKDLQNKIKKTKVGYENIGF